MKRLLQVSFDTFIYSLITTIIWFVLSALVDKDLINIFILTYPIQYIANILKSIFATGANISETKGNKNEALSGLTLGIIFTIIIFGLILLNINSYIKFMGINVSVLFCIYSVIQIFLQTILNLVITNLYYKEKNNLANKYSLIFYIINLVLIIITAVLFDNPYYIIIPTLTVLSLFTIYTVIKIIKKFKFKINILKWLKYDLVELVDHLFFGLGYLFGISIALNFGENYALAITFVALITDIQWDVAISSFSTVAKIDISKNNYNYKEHMKNDYKLTLIIIISIILMFLILFHYYNVDLKITLILLSFHIFDFLIYPIGVLQITYLQLEHSALNANINNLFARIGRLVLSFLKTPYCNVIAMVVPGFIKLIIMNIIFNKNYKVNELGFIEKRYKEVK